MQEKFEASFSIRDHNYKIGIETKGSNTFGIDLVDEDSMNRWSADFSASYIKNITRKVGSEKRISVFWRMLQTALEGSSNEVSFDVLTTQDVKNMQKKASQDLTAPVRDDKRYIIITQTTEFEQIKYPLLLQSNPLAASEFAEIIKKLKRENAFLRQQNGTEKIQELEAQIYDLNQAYVELRDSKDLEIADLKAKLSKAQKQQNSGYGISNRGNSREMYSPRDINSPAQRNRVQQPHRSSSVRPTYKRAPSVSSNSSRISQNSRSSRGSARSSNSRESSPGRGAPVRSPYYKSPKRTTRSIEEETDERLRKLKRYVAQKYKQ